MNFFFLLAKKRHQAKGASKIRFDAGSALQLESEYLLLPSSPISMFRKMRITRFKTLYIFGQVFSKNY